MSEKGTLLTRLNNSASSVGGAHCLVYSVYLVYLVYLVSLVCLVDLVGLVTKVDWVY